jgi:lysozyme
MSIADKARLVALVGTPCAALLLYNVPKFEGTILRGYRDPIGIVTACTGHTKTAVLGRPYTPEECQELLAADLVDAAKPVLTCTPNLRDKPMQLAAATSLTFNIGGAAYCHSSIARKFNEGDYGGACADFSRWVYAGGRVLPGLVNRRAVERDMCEGRLQ